jgi:hypothetical protein
VVSQIEVPRRRKEGLARQHLTLLTQKLELASQLNDSLLPRRRRLLDELSSLDVDALARRLEEVREQTTAAVECFTWLTARE